MVSGFCLDGWSGSGSAGVNIFTRGREWEWDDIESTRKCSGWMGTSR